MQDSIDLLREQHAQAFLQGLDDWLTPLRDLAIINRHVHAKDAEEHRIFYTDISDPWDNDGNTFLPDRWYALKGQDIFDLSAWRSLGIF